MPKLWSRDSLGGHVYRQVHADRPATRSCWHCDDTQGVAHVGFGGELSIDDVPDEPRYTSHFATCPNAAEHRKR